MNLEDMSMEQLRILAIRQEEALVEANARLMEQQEIAQAANRQADQVSIWVLSREINDYNQDGAYFVAAWPHKPNAEEIMKEHRLSENEAQRCIETGGGRIDVEDEWYFLTCVQQPAAPQKHAQAALSDEQIDTAELASELERQWLVKTIAELRCSIMLNEGGFKAGFHTALDEIETRCALASQQPAAAPDRSRVNGNDAPAVLDDELQALLTTFDMGLGFALCHRDFSDTRNAVKQLQRDFTEIRSALASQASKGAGVVEGWKVRERRNREGELLDCFIEAPPEGDMAYALEVLGDDYTGYGGVERKLEHCQLIVSLVNAAAPSPAQPALVYASQTFVHGEPGGGHVYKTGPMAVPGTLPAPVAEDDRWHSLTCDGTCSPLCKDAPPVAVPIERLQNWIDVIHDNERSMGDRLQSLSSIFAGVLRGNAVDKYPLQSIREQQPPADAAPVEAINLIARDVAELDYSSDIAPDLMQVSEADLRLILERHLSDQPSPAQGDNE
jgi:hypothetical protein